MDKEERYTYHIDEYDEFDWCVIDNTTDEDYVYLEDITKVLNKQNQQIIDIEAKLAESEETIRLLKMSNDALREDNLDLSYNQVDNVYETATEMSKGWESQYQQEIAQLKQQLAEKDQAIEGLQEINQSLGQTCNNDAKEIERLREKENLLNLIVDGYYTPTNIVKRQIREQNQTAIAVLEEMLDNEVYINSKLDFEDGNYVLSKIIRTKIEELKNGRN